MELVALVWSIIESAVLYLPPDYSFSIKCKNLWSSFIEVYICDLVSLKDICCVLYKKESNYVAPIRTFSNEAVAHNNQENIPLPFSEAQP